SFSYRLDVKMSNQGCEGRRGGPPARAMGWHFAVSWARLRDAQADGWCGIRKFRKINRPAIKGAPYCGAAVGVAGKGQAMKVSNIGPAKGVDKSKRKSGASSSDAFADDLRAATADTAEQAAGTISGSAVAGVDAVLAMQAADDATQGRSKGLLMARGDRLLDRLEDLQMALLTGNLPKEKVIELAQALREKRPDTDDAGLNALIDEIELRAEVELAKLTR
ncbi:MAG TPA: hypothetical protein DC046_15065, partial [Rhodospirillaceae bacterium]|nr:hypothetical protein [Rhodospirillaceae bacterium]